MKFAPMREKRKSSKQIRGMEFGSGRPEGVGLSIPDLVRI
jgi:hypothetical protein